MGVSMTGEGCDAGIVDQIKLYSLIIVEAECGSIPDNVTRRLGGADKKDERELELGQHCETYEFLCTTLDQVNWCLMYDTHCGGSRELNDVGESEDPLNDPGWEDCDMLDFEEFKMFVMNDFMISYTTAAVRQCFAQTWCRQKLD
eukprot:CAMPEP_0198137014 /NCGR_PEP_ID=MMETSP1443-20131203/565_1 /TAXON_ID=186043 /ORGANISM="Entomoneis sp., Strain CCMP2396" /LENGTH=144 /DNA_ID=CAMNT_0043798329 /DNA_START=143 /DNA_END=577 /DNA_ORIENTATION=+